MDLLATVRKEGTRGGTGDFKWADVQGSSHREHYLGHSLMAPVGRWQRNRDLNWYAKSDSKGEDGEDPEQRAARERKEEIKRIKEAEEDALAKALGLPVPDRNNANMETLGNRKAIDGVLKDATGQNDNDTERGLGFGGGSTIPDGSSTVRDRIEGNAEAGDREMQHALKEYKRRHGDRNTRHRVQSRDQDRTHDHYQDRRHHRDAGRPRGRHQGHHARDSSRENPRHRSRSRGDDREYRHRERTRDRSRSPYAQKYNQESHRRRAQTSTRSRD